jgi:GNAT superfamily N-acetyltransferase
MKRSDPGQEQMTTEGVADGDGPAAIVERTPTVEEYLHLIEAVGWRPREPRAVEIALRASLFAVCAEVGGAAVGCGRVIGDGGLHLYLADVVVVPAHQRRGIGTRIVDALTRFVEAVPFRNVLVAVVPTPGLQRFYQRHGYRAQGAAAPAMYRWVNR